MSYETCFNGLTTVNIELTTRCNKNCWMCGRRKVERDYPELALQYGDMDMALVRKLAKEIPPGIVVQFHNNGEPLLYPHLKETLQLFAHTIRCFDTNGKLLMERADDIMGNMETLTVSTFQNDPEADEQYRIVEEFLQYKRSKTPNVIIRCLGSVDKERYKKLGCIIAERVLHSPMGSFHYERKTTVPEIGICLDFLNHMAIRYDGSVSICVRFDPTGNGIIGNAHASPLLDIWNSTQRLYWKQRHVAGNRDAVPLCATCEFWGVPRGY